MKKRPYFLAGLTGGVGAGKSLVGKLLAGAGATVFNLDDIGREVSLAPRIQEELVRLAGLTRGPLDRSALREKLFSSPDLRKAVESFLHPIILAEFEKRADAAAKRGARVVVCEAALLVESGFHRQTDELIVVTAPEPERKRRLIARDKISSELADRIVRAQAADADKIPFATHVVANDGDPSHLEAKVRTIVAGWKKKGLLS